VDHFFANLGFYVFYAVAFGLPVVLSIGWVLIAIYGYRECKRNRAAER
jgi:hypothetical protein